MPTAPKYVSTPWGVSEFDPYPGGPLITSRGTYVSDQAVLDQVQAASATVSLPLVYSDSGPGIDIPNEIAEPWIRYDHAQAYLTDDQIAQAQANLGLQGLDTAGIALSLANRVRVDAVQTFTDSEKAQARANIGVDGSATSDGRFVVAAPVGNATTDMASINAAITAAVAAGGGLVILRAGVYWIDNLITFPNGVTPRGLGGGSTSTTGVTQLKCVAAGAQVKIAGGGGEIAGMFEINGNSVATLPFFRTGGTGANARYFLNLTVHHSAQDVAQFWGAQNDLYEQCGFAYAVRDLAWFDQGFGGVTFNRCEWSGTVGRYWHRYDAQITGGVGQAPFNIVHMGTTNVEGGSNPGDPQPVSHVKLIAGVDITYDKTWFYSVSGTSGPSIDVGTGCIVNLLSPSMQSTPNTKNTGSKAIQVNGTGRVTIFGRAQYLNFDKPMNIDGIAAHIFDNTPPEFYNCSTPRFYGTNGATVFQWENDSGGLRTNFGATSDPTEVNYTASRNGLVSIRRVDGTIEYYDTLTPGFGGPKSKWGPRAGGYAVGTPLGAGTPVGIGGGTTAVRDATWPASAALANCFFFNLDTGTLQRCDGSAWNDVSGGASSGGADLPSYYP